MKLKTSLQKKTTSIRPRSLLLFSGVAFLIYLYELIYLRTLEPCGCFLITASQKQLCMLARLNKEKIAGSILE